MAAKDNYLPIGLTIAAGVALVAVIRGRKSAPVVVPTVAPPRARPTSTAPPPPSPDAVDAPGFPYSVGEIGALEMAQVEEKHGEWTDLMEEVMAGADPPGTIPTEEDYGVARDVAEIESHKSIPSALTDLAFGSLYGDIKIPSRTERGKGWGPFVSSWTRMYESIRERPWVSG